MDALTEFKKNLRPGRVWRRADLLKLSSAADRHLQHLVEDGTLDKVSHGTYYYPKKSRFGELPPDEKDVLKAFLKDDDFYVTSLNVYNALGLGTTQLYNENLVYNHKRDGRYMLDGRSYYFLKNRKFPKKPDTAFLVVDMVNNMKMLAEDNEKLKEALAKKVRSMDVKALKKAVKEYGGVRTRAYFDKLMDDAA